MLKLAIPPLVPATPTPAVVARKRRIAIRACRPSLIDLRFKGDAWVVGTGLGASVLLGDFALSRVNVSPLDVPSLNRALLQVRFGQARRNYAKRMRKIDELES